MRSSLKRTQKIPVPCSDEANALRILNGKGRTQGEWFYIFSPTARSLSLLTDCEHPSSLIWLFVNVQTRPLIQGEGVMTTPMWNIHWMRPWPNALRCLLPRSGFFFVSSWWSTLERVFCGGLGERLCTKLTTTLCKQPEKKKNHHHIRHLLPIFLIWVSKCVYIYISLYHILEEYDYIC